MRFKLITALFTIPVAAAILSINMGQARADETGKAIKPPTTAPVTVKWEDAAKHVGETATITGPVKGTHVATGNKSLILNVGKDYPDPDRFTIMIATDEDHPANEDDYKDKTVTVTGKIEMYHKAAEIRVVKAADVKIEKQK